MSTYDRQIVGRNSHVISYWTLCRVECGGMFWLTLYEVYAICDLCIFGNIIREMLRRILFLHIVSLPRFNGHSSTYGVYLSLFYLCILQRIWRGRLPGVCESGALATLVIPFRDCPPLVWSYFITYCKRLYPTEPFPSPENLLNSIAN